ncbi:MAG TPA: winged helix-turn-helix domain-containing protein [Stellaceae bacterium]
MKTNADPQPAAIRGENPLAQGANRSSPATADAAVEFGRFRVLLRQRQLFAGDAPVELGTRAFDLLLVLLEADGSLVTKDQLLSGVWPGIVVSEENLKVQVSALRKALGADRDVIRTEFGRGYRFTGVLSRDIVTGASHRPTRSKQPPTPTLPSPASTGGVGGRPQNYRQSPRCSFSSI